MSKTQMIDVAKLSLDLKNFRTMAQKNEQSAIHALITIDPDYFWGLTESILEDGYLPTENVIVLQAKNKILEVREGNRRVAVLKLILGLVPLKKFDVPKNISTQITQLSPEWITENLQIPCNVFPAQDIDKVNQIVSRIHGPKQKASRLGWRAVSKARYSRDIDQNSEPGLTLLEKYLLNGNNISNEQKERWAGDYPLTVLDEAISKIAKSFGAKSGPDLTEAYPRVRKNRPLLEKILHDIGIGTLDFKRLRENEFYSKYDLEPPEEKKDGSGSGPSAAGKAKTQPGTGSAGNGGESANVATGSASGNKGKVNAAAADDPKSVMRQLRTFKPKGADREKVVALVNEALCLKIEKTPMAFCFLLRSMFEISAKAYCKDHKSQGLKSIKSDGNEKTLEDLLRDVAAHIKSVNPGKEMVKKLHGAMAELANKNGILSCTSMNQLVHNPKFVVKETHIAAVFTNIFPLLELMNS